MSTPDKTQIKNPLSPRNQINKLETTQIKSSVPNFRVGDTVKVHAKIVEGNKERIQIFEGLVIKRHRKNDLKASFTVRKVSYNVGVERTFLLHSPRIDKIQIVSKGQVRRARLFYLRPLRGKASRIQSELIAEDAVTSTILAPEAHAKAIENNSSDKAETASESPAIEATQA